MLTWNKLEIQKHSKWQHKNTANKQSNKHTSRQTNTFTNTRIGVIRGVITPPRSNQLLNPLAQEPDGRVVSITKKEYGSAVDFRFILSWKSISDE